MLRSTKNSYKINMLILIWDPTILYTVHADNTIQFRQYNTESYNLDLKVCSEVPSTLNFSLFQAEVVLGKNEDWNCFVLANSTDTCWVLGCLCGYWLYTRSNGGDSNSTSPEMIWRVGIGIMCCGGQPICPYCMRLVVIRSFPSMTLCRHAVRTFEHLQYLLLLILSMGSIPDRGVGRGRALRARAPPSSAEATHRSPTFSGLVSYSSPYTK